MSHLTLIAIGVSVIVGWTQTRDDTYTSWSLPVWVQQTLQTPSFSGRYELHFAVNPFYQRGDFDGDRKPDCAVLIRERSTKKIGIVFVHAASQKWHVVGAGSPLGNGGDDWSWLAVWRVEPGSTLRAVAGLRSEVLLVEKPESAGALLYWDGKRYRWVQHGD